MFNKETYIQRRSELKKLVGNGVISEGLYIGHEHEHTVVVARILQLDTTAQWANIVSEMEFTGGAITSQNYFSHCILNVYDINLAAKVA